MAMFIMKEQVVCDLARDAVQQRLSREVLANERRWRQLLKDVHLLAARVDRDGRVLIAAGSEERTISTLLGFVAIVVATINVVGGFLVTHRMLGMFRKKG